MMMMLEKLEECPSCGEVKDWLYDSQLCTICGYGDPANDSRHQQKSLCIGMETLRRLARGEAVVIDDVALIAADDLTLAELQRFLENRGLKVVPIEPTLQMAEHAVTFDGRDGTGILRDEAEAAWADMIEHAPPLNEILDRKPGQ